MNDRQVNSMPKRPPEALPGAAKAGQQKAPASPRSVSKSFRWYVVFGLAVIIGLIAVVLPQWLGPKVDVYAVTRHDLVQTVVASGHIETPYRVNIGSQITGTVIEIPVEEGQEVKAGDILIRIDNRESASAVIQARGVVAQMEAKMRQLQEVILPSARQTLKQAESTAATARSNYARAIRLLSDGYTTQANFDAVRRDRDIAETAARNATLQVMTNQPGGSDYVMAETQLAQAKASLANAEAKANYTTITAPVDGRLITRNVERGNVVQPTDILLVLAPKGEIRIVLQIDERDLSLLRLGQSALASADAYADQTFPAEIVYINPSVDLQRASVLVKLLVPSPPSYLIQDMTVSVDIEVGRQSQALVVPTAAVHDAKSAAPWVFAVIDGQVQRRDVALGIRADDKMEVVKGLDDGMLVVSASNAAVVAGQRVRPVKITNPGS